MKQFFSNKYVKGLTQFIQAEHFGTMDFIDYHCQSMGISRDEYMAYYGVKESVEISEEKKQSTDKGPIDDEKIESSIDIMHTILDYGRYCMDHQLASCILLQSIHII